MNRLPNVLARVLLVPLVAALAGCGSGGPEQPPFPDLHPVQGVVKRGGAAASKGAVQFAPDTPNPAFLVNAEVGDDGTFTLTTVRTTDKSGERKSGAPAGRYKVTYTPPLGDQTAGGQLNPVELPNVVTVAAGDNNLTIDLPRR